MQVSPRILLVDDDSNILTIYSKRFAAAGFETVTARNGEDGLRMAGKHVPDLILLDLMMPRLDGFETLARLKEHMELQHIPVVILTSLSDRRDIDRCNELGCAAYLIKTQVTPEDVVRKAKEILRMT